MCSSPAGVGALADVVVARELKMEARANPDLWAACIGGALPEPELFEIAAAAGLRDGRITERFDCFRNTSAEVKALERPARARSEFLCMQVGEKR